ncbi:S9 family peptidase [Acidiluteibacter ferrifornacis]|uniref:Alpha/beta fold hydrolase n=1 Tax=Acidiluteibacter ferrifornacis TaxID=2692424 RepID=A0A6N9NL32_9FLAO|nr:S9 family peptidase [Acidiluteibacter ferrifornacis]NBG65940.1 alpha/beta fold hydrolase [Acidiluteibacter ferrifornacis]
MNKIYLAAAALIIGFSTTIKAQNTGQISLEDIWKKYSYSPKYVRGLTSMKDGLHYTTLERSKQGTFIVKYAYNTGKAVDTIIKPGVLKYDNEVISINDYSFSADEKKMLIATDQESIYRHSSKSQYFVVELNSGKLQKLTDGNKQMYATFSPSADKVGFVRDNNLFYVDLKTMKETAVTTDGEYNKIINGASDWVYEEELVLVQAFQWANDGSQIAFYKFDESRVKQFNMAMYGSLYPTDYEFKYPKAGEENSKVSIHVYHLENGNTVDVELTKPYEYITAIQWTKSENQLALLCSNRHQNELDINIANTTTGKVKTTYTETSDTYIEMPFFIEFMEDQKSYIVLSERDGFNHIYQHFLNGGKVNQITKGEFEITELYGIDEKNKKVYFQSAEVSPMERHVYSIGLNGKSKKKLTAKAGTNDASFSNSFDYFINYHTDANHPYYITLNTNDGKVKRVLEDNKALNEKLDQLAIAPKEFFSFKTSEGISLNAWMIKPANFDASKKYPVFLTIYGGPGSQTVTDSWGSSNYFWHQMLAQQGYIVVSVDNRGTGARGAEFKKCTYKQLGKLEVLDQIEAAKHFATLLYVDGDRIGVQGWSYGGFMSSNLLLKGAEQFKMAIAVAPVTNWRFYDSIYTERYMQTPQENPEGYDDNSPINHVGKLEGKYLLVHGTADDNVHYQNAAEMTTALVNADKQFTQFSYPDKNHGIYGGNTRFHLYTLMTNFIKENL